MNQSQQDIIRTCDKVKQLLLDKNKKYGDAALNPTRILSKSGSVEQILIRIDDKLNRIQKGVGLLGTDEDVVQDLAGYFILLMIVLDRQKEEQRRNPRSIDGAWDHKEPEKPSRYHYVGEERTHPPSVHVGSTDLLERSGIRPLTSEEYEDRGLPYESFLTNDRSSFAEG